MAGFTFDKDLDESKPIYSIKLAPKHCVDINLDNNVFEPFSSLGTRFYGHEIFE